MTKRCTAFMAVIAMLLLMLCGCTPAEPTIPTPADCGTEAGMILHTKAQSFSYSPNEGIVSTKDLLFVPSGTVIACEQNMAVYPYDNDLYLNQDILAQTGQATVGDYIVVMAAGEVTLSEDCYIRVSVEGALEDVLVTYPEERIGEVRVFSSDYEAYQKDYDRIVPLIKQAPDTAVNYVFITDLHYDVPADSKIQLASVRKQVETVVKLANESDAIDFVVVGGDNTSGCYSKKKAIEYMSEVFAPLKECKKPVLMLMGNHDDNSYNQATKLLIQSEADKLFSKKQWNDAVLSNYSPQTVVHDSQNQDSVYYYYDLADKKTRVVCLDPIDYPQQLDENGNILQVSLAVNKDGNSIVGRAWYGYSKRQLEWLAKEALTAADGWDYVFLSHMHLNDSVAYGSQIRKLIGTFQQRAVYTDEEIGTVDFSAATGEILVYQYGHVHGSRMAKLTDTSVWSVATSTANISQLSSNKRGSENFRAFGTDTECCFDVMSVQKGGHVKRYAFGVGEDIDSATKE